MSSLRLFTIAKTAQLFIATRATVTERTQIRDGLYPLAHKRQPYKESEGIIRIAPGFYKYVTEKYVYYFYVSDDKKIEIADIRDTTAK